MRQRVRFHCGTAEVMARAVPMEGADIPPGSSGYVHFQLEEPVVSMPGDRFVIRRFSPVTTIGGGTILESGTAKVRHRNRDDRIRRVEMLAEGDIGGFLMERLRAARAQGISLPETAREVGRTPAEARTEADALVSGGMAVFMRDGSSERLVLRESCDEAARTVLDALRLHHAGRPASRGMPTSNISKVFPGLPQWFVKGIVAGLLENGSMRREGDRIALAEHPAEMPAEVRAGVDRAVSEIEAAGLDGFDASRADSGMIDSLFELGLVIELDKGIVTTPSVAAMAFGTVARGFGEAEFRLGEMRELLGVSRKLAVQWAGIFDGLGYTVRNGDFRKAAGPRPGGDGT